MLGVRHLEILNYVDGDLDQADPREVISQTAKLIRHYRPQVIVTFPPDGSYGHPDHIAISQFTLGAILQAASPNGLNDEEGEPYQVKKFYYLVDSKELEQTILSLCFELEMEVDGVVRSEVGWHDWAITTRVDATNFWRRTWQAVLCHRSQLNGGFDTLQDASEDIHKILWGKQNFYRVFSLVNGGRKVEHDLFAGLRR